MYILTLASKNKSKSILHLQTKSGLKTCKRTIHYITPPAWSPWDMHFSARRSSAAASPGGSASFSSLSLCLIHRSTANFIFVCSIFLCKTHGIKFKVSWSFQLMQILFLHQTLLNSVIPLAKKPTMAIAYGPTLAGEKSTATSTQNMPICRGKWIHLLGFAFTSWFHRGKQILCSQQFQGGWDIL